MIVIRVFGVNNCHLNNFSLFSMNLNLEKLSKPKKPYAKTETDLKFTKIKIKKST